MDSGAERGVSEIIGFILIFSLLIVSFSVYQGMVVPGENREVEFDHNQQVQSQLQDLRNAILTTASTGTGPAVNVHLGTNYPDRTLTSNLGVAAGSLRTDSWQQPIVIANTSALDSETSDYFGDSQSELGPFDSMSITYQPSYSFYSSAPATTYENTLVYNRFETGDNLSITGQTIVEGRRISIVTVAGNLSRAGQRAVTLNPEAVSAPTTTVGIEDQGGPITITFPTGLSVQNWTTILAEEYDPTGTDPNRYITDIERAGPNAISIVLEPDIVYELRLARIGIGRGITPVKPEYITDIAGDDASLVENGTTRLVAQVRDRFNNPISNATVRATISKGPGSIEGQRRIVSDSTGKVTFVYSAPPDVSNTRDVTVTAHLTPNTTANRSVTYHLRVLNTDGSAESETTTQDSAQINPGGAGSVRLSDPSSVGGGGSTGVYFDLRNHTDATGEVRIVQARVTFYHKGGNRPEPTSAHFDDNSDPLTGGTNLTIGEGYSDITPPIPLDPDSTRVYLEFDSNVESEDFYIVAMRFEFPSGDTTTASYFVSHPR